MSAENEIDPYASLQRRATKLAKVGAWLQILPFIGLVVTVIAFPTLGTNGTAAPSKLSAAMGEILIMTALGFVGGMIGFLFLGVAVFAQGRQPNWVQVIYGLSALPALSIISGGIMMIFRMQ